LSILLERLDEELAVGTGDGADLIDAAKVLEKLFCVEGVALA
jgi:hypothetical protein